MNCKHCQAELEDGVTVCPDCGEINEHPEVAKTGSKPTVHNSPLKIAASVVAIILVVAILSGIVISGMEGFGKPSDGTVATAPANGNSDDVTCKGSYTVSDRKARRSANKVVATMGDAELTNAELQIYYWMQTLTFLNEYGSYAMMFGLDYTQPLDTQMSMANASYTWQQYFLSRGLEAWETYQALALQAKAAGYENDEDYQTYAANIKDEMYASVAANGYATVDEFLKNLVGPGCNEEAYFDYLKTYYLSYLYFNEVYDSIDPTDAEVEAYFDENASAYAENGIEKDDGKRLVDVRHILIIPEGGTTDEAGVTTYSEEEWEACRVAAQALLDEWLAGNATEETFAEMANTHSEDPGSNTAGGLYTYIAEGDMVQEFEDWCFDETRAVGDYGLVKTSYGYHIMYYVDSRPVWFAYAESDLTNKLSDEIVPNAIAAYEVNVNYKAIVLGELNLTGEEEPENDNTLVIVLCVAVVILAVALVAVLVRKPREVSPEEEAEDEEDDESEDDEDDEEDEEDDESEDEEDSEETEE